LTYKEITALAGLWYRDLLLDHQDEPGDADNWANYQDFLRDGLAYFDPESDGIKREPYDPRQGVRMLSEWFNIDNFLAARGLNDDHQSRTRLVEHVAVALIQGAETLKRRAVGDYGPDEVVKRFPVWQPTKRTATNGASGPRLTRPPRRVDEGGQACASDAGPLAVLRGELHSLHGALRCVILPALRHREVEAALDRARQQPQDDQRRQARCLEGDLPLGC
jgi:hypothetical protein